MQRRSFLKLGLGSAVVLAVAGGAVALIQPGLVQGKLSSAGRNVFAGAARALLDGTLPADPAAQQASINALLARIDDLTQGLPPHVQGELSQLLSLLDSTAGRVALVGLGTDWASASVAQIGAALQGMRESRMALREQAYSALHDIVGGSYFAGSENWPFMGYPGPITI